MCTHASTTILSLQRVEQCQYKAPQTGLEELIEGEKQTLNVLFQLIALGSREFVEDHFLNYMQVVGHENGIHGMQSV